MPRRPEPVHRQVGHDSREVCLRIGNLCAVGRRPLEPGILDDVLGVCGGAQQPIRDGEQQFSMLGERLFVGGHCFAPPATAPCHRSDRRDRPDQPIGGPWAGAHRFFVRHGESAGQVEPAGGVVGVGELDDGVVPAEADGLVHVAEAERLGLLAVELAHDRGGGVQGGRDAALAGAVHDPVALPDRRRVADGVDVGMRYRAQGLVGDDAAAVVDMQPRCRGQR